MLLSQVPAYFFILSLLVELVNVGGHFPVIFGFLDNCVFLFGGERRRPRMLIHDVALVLAHIVCFLSLSDVALLAWDCFLCQALAFFVLFILALSVVVADDVLACVSEGIAAFGLCKVRRWRQVVLGLLVR